MPRRTRSELASMIQLYMEDGLSLRRVEVAALGMPYQERHGGYVARKILRTIGISDHAKGSLSGESRRVIRGIINRLVKVAKHAGF